VDVRLTNRNVDLVAEGFDAALRAATKPLKDSSMVARKVAPVELHLFASPTYLARRGSPRTIEEAREHDWVAFRGLREIDAARKRIVADDFFFVLEAVRAGAGIGMLPSFLAQHHLSSGQLVRVLPRVFHPGGNFVLLYPKARHVPRKVTAFRDFLLETLPLR
jgi:DNA-binding transcriptional LysR family regulator